MIFQSIEFVVFMVAVFACYWKMQNERRWICLVAAGYLFYFAFDWRYLLILASMTLISFILARQIEDGNKLERKIYLIIYIFLALCTLGIFKYLSFFIDAYQSVLRIFNIYAELPVLKLILPVGISFYVFQTIGYIIDVYYKRISAEKHLGYYAASVAFFPILLSGPIERIQNLTKQLREEKVFSYDEGSIAFEQILVGYFKKLIIADSLSVYVDKVYSNVEGYQGFSLVLVIFFFSTQIYCDFSGYSDIAVGVSHLLGIKINENFRRPYLADSVKDFWSRWHMSLSTWFRDYVYIPLGGNRVAEWKRNRNLIVTFVLSGLWHGAGWTFLLWGAIHGALQVLEKKWNTYVIKINVPKMLKQIIIFLMISVVWVFFKAETLSDACFVLSHGLDGLFNLTSYLKEGIMAVGMSKIQMGLLAFFIIALSAYDIKNEHANKKRLSAITIILMAELALFYYMKYGIDNATFIYFQF